jgi:Domain of unknown function (DUF1707)
MTDVSARPRPRPRPMRNTRSGTAAADARPAPVLGCPNPRRLARHCPLAVRDAHLPYAVTTCTSDMSRYGRLCLCRLVLQVVVLYRKSSSSGDGWRRRPLAGRSHPRAASSWWVARILLGDSDREQLVCVLRQRYAAGRFDLDDLRRRAEIVCTAVYRDEAQPALDGLPSIAGGRAPAVPAARGPAPGRMAASAAVTPRRAGGSRLGADGRTVPRPVQRHDHAGLG